MLRLLFDFRSYQTQSKRGIGRYVLNLARAITDIENVELSLLISTKLPSETIPEDLKSKAEVYTVESFENYPINDNFDFLIKGSIFEDNHKLIFQFPKTVLKKCNDVVGISYDLIPLLFPRDYLMDDNRKYHYANLIECLKYLSHIFCISETTKSDTIKYTELPEDMFTTIYGGADFKKFESKNSEKKYSFKDRTNNLVYITGDDARKNYGGAARVFAKAYETGKIPKDSKLYLICRSSKNFKKTVKNELKGFKAKVGKQIIITDFIPDEDVVDLVSNAKASIMPSFYEGLGLPILESYIAGTPCFASNNSATKEFVNELSSFSPYDDDEFRDVIIRIYNDEEFCRQSLEYGRKIVKKYNWENSAKILVDKLRELKRQEHKSNKVAVLSILPPDESGIAGYSYRTHTLEPEKYDIFANIKTDSDYFDLTSNGKVKNIFPLDLYDYANFKEKYSAKIIVLGNSEHHINTLKKALETKGEENRFLYLHEAMILNLFFCYFDKNFEDVKNFLKKWYDIPETDGYHKLYIWLKEHYRFGIRPLINLTGIKNIIVNNEKAKELILKELSESEKQDVNIKVMFLPIEKTEAEKLNLSENGQYVIGTFGLPHEAKGSEIIINAIKFLNEKEPNKYKLIVAGYEAENFCKKYPSDYTEVYDAPDDKTLFSLMTSVDLAVQLRKHPHGESSGCIAQLMGMGQKIITTEGFIDNELGKYIVSTVQSRVPYEQLANVIEKGVKSDFQYDKNYLTEKYSFKNLSKELYNYCINNY